MPPSPAPAAPAAAPAIPATPAAPPTPATPAAPEGGDEPGAHSRFDEAFSDLEPAELPKPPEPAKPDAGKPAGTPPAGKATPKPAAPAAPAVPVPDEIPSTIKTNAELRKWALERHNAAKAIEQDKSKLEARIKELSEIEPKTRAEQAKLAEQIKNLETRLEEKENFLRLHNYENSEEYKNKYEIPYKQAYQSMLGDLSELTITEGSAEIGDLKERPATEADFHEILNAKLGMATKLAKEKFGDNYTTILNHRAALRKIMFDSTTALEEYKKNAAKNAEEEHTRTTADLAHTRELWQSINTDLSSNPKGSEFWGDDPADAQVAKELQKGFEFADQRFSKAFFELPKEKRILIDAGIRHRVAGFYKQLYLARKYKSEAESLRAELIELRKGGPGPGGGGEPDGGGGGTPTEQEEGAMSVFDKKL